MAAWSTVYTSFQEPRVLSSVAGNPRKPNHLRGINLEEQVKDKKGVLVMPEIKAFLRC